MRWFKHMTTSSDDEKLSALIDATGLEGYGFWWRLVEIVVYVSDDNKKSVTYSISQWASKMGITKNKWLKLSSECQKTGLCSLVVEEKCATIFIKDLPESKDCEQGLRPELSTQWWKKTRQRIFKRDEYTCQYCGARNVPLECDHIVPVSVGGTSHIENLVTACRTCNRSKGAKQVQEWLQ